jgi:hypothetical protein
MFNLEGICSTKYEFYVCDVSKITILSVWLMWLIYQPTKQEGVLFRNVRLLRPQPHVVCMHYSAEVDYCVASVRSSIMRGSTRVGLFSEYSPYLKTKYKYRQSAVLFTPTCQLHLPYLSNDSLRKFQ